VLINGASLSTTLDFYGITSTLLSSISRPSEWLVFQVPSWLFVAELGICVYLAGGSTSMKSRFSHVAATIFAKVIFWKYLLVIFWIDSQRKTEVLLTYATR
jgi:hypothetical protein